MKQVLILGAGKSSTYLIKYLAENAVDGHYRLVVVDRNMSLVPPYISSLQNVSILEIPSAGLSDFQGLISKSTLTISMLPASMHMDIAKLCLEYSSHLITPSYVSEGMQALNEKVRAKHLVFLNEMGLDPGIDHMTTMKLYHELSQKGYKLYGYRSYTGGLVAKKNDTNPWHYKFSWNPQNVILAGQGGEARFKENGTIKRLHYSELFASSENLCLDDGSVFDAYANRDSLKYEDLYEWTNMRTLLRGTLRFQGFCSAWAVLVNLGLTDNSKKLKDVEGLSYFDFYSRFYNESLENYLCQFKADIREKLLYIGFGDAYSKILRSGTAAEILQSILELKWKLEPDDTDWIVMVHKMEFEKDDQGFEVESSLSIEGADNTHTAMAKTVGLPTAFAAELILGGEYTKSGVQIPVEKDLYIPVLNKLESFGIIFKEVTRQLD